MILVAILLLFLFVIGVFVLLLSTNDSDDIVIYQEKNIFIKSILRVK